MNCFRSHSLSTEKAEERRMRKLLQVDKKKNSHKEIKLLLLGTHESGKSTFVKQLRFKYEKVTFTEIQGYIPIIYQNMFTSMQAMIAAMDVLNIDYNFPEIMEYVQLIRSINADITAFDNLNVIALKKLWAFEGIQESYRLRSKYQLSDSTEYFFNNIDRVATANYLPSKDDILRVFVRTKNVIEYYLPSIRITDVGGQRSDRKQWCNLFEACNALVFMSAISEYDQVLAENNTTNRLTESLTIFDVIINLGIIQAKGMVLFLNKIDLFENKIKSSNFAQYFPEYKGPKSDVISAKKFIQDMFVDKKKDNSVGALYTFFTVAIDSENINSVFKLVKKLIVKNHMKQFVLK